MVLEFKDNGSAHSRTFLVLLCLALVEVVYYLITSCIRY
jgi:hypothetical protein